MFVFRFVWSRIHVPQTSTARRTQLIVWGTWLGVESVCTTINRSSCFSMLPQRVSKITKLFGSGVKFRKGSPRNREFRIFPCTFVFFCFVCGFFNFCVAVTIFLWCLVWIYRRHCRKPIDCCMGRVPCRTRWCSLQFKQT